MVLYWPALWPINVLQSPVVKLAPALQPIETLYIVSALSEAGPAPLPATKFPWSSCVNPPALIPVKLEPSP